MVVDSFIDDKLGKEQQFDNVQKIDEYEAEAELSLGNLSLKDKINSFLNACDTFLKINSIRVLLRFRKTYKNYMEIFRKEKYSEYPIKAFLQNGSELTLYGKKDLSLLTHNSYWKYCMFIKNYLYLKKDQREVIFYKSELGDMVGVFAYERYARLSVKNRTVIDVGAAIGDSAIYFALNDAKKIIAIEPYIENVKIMGKNIILNDFSKKIFVIQAVLSNKEGKAIIDGDLSGPGNRTLISKKNGSTVPAITLKNIIPDNDENLVLKMDCEGSEYSIILNTDKKILRKFTQIIMEYHFGYQNLKLKLESAGFTVTTTKPCHVFGQTSYFGYLFATRKDSLSAS